MKFSMLRPQFIFFSMVSITLCFLGTLYGDGESDTSINKSKVTNEYVLLSESEQTDRAMLEVLGYMTVYRDGLKELGFGAEDAESIARGLKRALNDTSIDPAIQDKMPEFQAFIEKRIKLAEDKREQSQKELTESNIAEGKNFIESLNIDPSVQISGSGLHYKILDPGNSKLPILEDTVRVHYKGTRIDGTEFDSSYKRGKPADFPLKGVVPGFSEGLMKIGEGGKIILFIPSDLAYGNNPRPGGVIQAGDTLIFECELIKVNP
ncbi:MAG: peptidylprolyl isomerase [Puniceicoccaceae bacterium]|nr:peptidylprolyl isomerase [Puniceicoccaceae bacterium]